jgi:SPP1 family predicted phage head-tail adaptor
MQAGDFRVILTLQSKTITQDEELNPVETWESLKTVWAQPLEKTSREFFRLATMNAEITQAFRIRYAAGITAHMRVIFKETVLDIIGDPINEGERNISMLLSCKGVT